MLAAYLNGKLRPAPGTEDDISDDDDSSGTIESTGEVPGFDPDAVGRHEDPLTSTVFERLAYLPASERAAILDRCLSIEHGVAPPLGDPLARFAFWPRYSRAGTNPPRRYVEPDVVVESESGVCVIEVKWAAVHTLRQLQDQLSAVAARHAGRSLWLVVVGREPPVDDAGNSIISAVVDGSLAGIELRGVSLLRWEALAEAVERATTTSREEHSPHGSAILLDIRSFLRDRGFHRFRELADMPIARLSDHSGISLYPWKS